MRHTGVLSAIEQRRVITPTVVEEVIGLVQLRDTLEAAFDAVVPYPSGVGKIGIVVMSLGQWQERCEHPAYGIVREASANIVTRIASLSLGHARQLLMVLYIGRGDYTPRSILASNRIMAGEKSSRIIGEVIAGKAPAADYLRRGMVAVWGQRGGRA